MSSAQPGPESGTATRIAEILNRIGIEFTQREPGQFLAVLPGTNRLQTPTWLLVREQSLFVQAFVCRQPDENHVGVYRFMLQRNARLYGVHYALDRIGDIHLVGRLPLDSLAPEGLERELDRVLGQVLEAADGDFNTFLGLGFASSIRREYAWRTERGESLANLKPFEHLLP